jgi:4-amino-4-deoxy-L-arabinose transferase-like glycosyltransferase
MTVEPRSHSRRNAFFLRAIVIAAVATALSLIWAVYFRSPELRFDENYYYPLAQKIAGGNYEDGYVIRGPLYPLFLAGIFKVFGEGFLPALIVQSLIRGLVVITVAYMGRKYISAAAGLVAGAMLAFYPALLAAYMSFLTEAVYVPLFLLSMYFIERTSCAERVRGAVQAGVMSGLAALARSTSFFLTIVLAIWFAVGKSKTGRMSWPNLARAAVLVLVMFAVISPWTIRNAVVHGGFIAIGDDSAFNLYLITSGERIRVAVQEWSSWGTHPERQSEAYSRWLAYLREDPGFHIKRLGVVLPRIFSPTWESPARLLSTVEGAEGPEEIPALRTFFAVLHPLAFWLVMGGGLAGLFVLEKNGKRRTLILIVVVYFILLHGMTLARARFMLPLACLLSIYSGGLVATGLERLGWTRPSRRSP